MTAPVWRGDAAQRIPFRDWCRDTLPSLGLAVIDLDAIVRAWTAPDPTGVFMLLETKTHGKRTMTEAQRRTFALIDELLTDSPRYCGFFLLVFSGESFKDSDKVWLNDHPVTEAEVTEHLTFRWPAVSRYSFKRKKAS